MEWYHSSGVNEVVVPRDHGDLNRFPSQDRWMQWGLNTGESFDALEKTLVVQERAVDNLGDDLEMDYLVGDRDQLELSGGRGGISESSNCWTTLMHSQDYQVDGFRGTNQTDENFANSFLVDEMPCSEQFHSYGSSESQGAYSAADSLTGDMLLDLHDFETSKHLEAERFPSALDWENMEADAGQCSFTIMMNNAVPQFKSPLENVQVQPEQVCANGDIGNMISAEESVLQELDNVMQQMADTTRLCFRDALYRLANESGKQARVQGKHRDSFTSERHFGIALPNQTFRSEGIKKAPEARSNAIDRTIADLMFGNPCSSGSSQHSASTDVDQGAFSTANPDTQSQLPNSQILFSTTNAQGVHLGLHTIRNMVQN